MTTARSTRRWRIRLHRRSQRHLDTRVLPDNSGRSLQPGRSILPRHAHSRARSFTAALDPSSPKVPTIDCSRAYLHHLVRMNEPLATTLASMHNVYFMNHLMAQMRASIMADEI